MNHQLSIVINRQFVNEKSINSLKKLILLILNSWIIVCVCVCVEHCMYRVSNRRLQWSVLFLLTADVVESEKDVMMVGQRGWKLDFNFIMEIRWSEVRTFEKWKRKEEKYCKNVSVNNPFLTQNQTKTWPTVVPKSRTTNTVTVTPWADVWSHVEDFCMSF